MYRYHSIYYKEVYRPRGRFWYRDAVLPSYHHSYDLIDNVLSPAEEAALDHVLCSPETSYGDVAGQVYIHNYLLLLHTFIILDAYLILHLASYIPYTSYINHNLRLSYTSPRLALPHIYIDVHYASPRLLPSPVLPLSEVLLPRQQHH